MVATSKIMLLWAVRTCNSISTIQTP